MPQLRGIQPLLGPAAQAPDSLLNRTIAGPGQVAKNIGGSAIAGLLGIPGDLSSMLPQQTGGGIPGIGMIPPQAPQLSTRGIQGLLGAEPDRPESLLGEFGAPDPADIVKALPLLGVAGKRLRSTTQRLRNPDGPGLIPVETIQHDPSLVSVSRVTDDLGDSIKVNARDGYTTNIKDIATPADGVLYRGMSADEFQAIKESGEIRSTGGLNQPSQQGQTIFSPQPGISEGFAIPKGFEDKAYIVAVRDPGTGIPNGALAGTETAIPGVISKDDILQVIEKIPATISETGRMSFVYRTLQ